MKLSCFVILPSNKPDGPVTLVPDDRWGLVELPSSVPDPPKGAIQIDFDQVYKLIIDNAVQKAKCHFDNEPVIIESKRGVDIMEAGDILPQVIERTCLADIVIVDITTANPNVFLEYGIRVVAKNRLNIMICHKGTVLPFDVQHERIIFYSMDVVDATKAQEDITDMIEAFLKPNADGAPPAQVEDRFRRYFDIHTGRNRDVQLVRAYEGAPTMIARLASFLFTQEPQPELKPQLFKFLRGIEEALRKDPQGSGRAIEFLETVSKIAGLSNDKLGELYYSLWECCNENDNLKDQAKDWMQKMKDLGG